MEKYTIETLRLKCKAKKIENYGKLTKKEELYRLCVLDEPLQSILATKTKKPKIDDPEKCSLNDKEALRCIKSLMELYPDITKDVCKPLVEGPAVGIITDRGKMIGMVNDAGDAIPIAPPLPIPSSNILPVVKTKTTTEKRELIKSLNEKKDNGEIASQKTTSALLEQISKGVALKKASTVTEKKKSDREKLLEDLKLGKDTLKKVDRTTFEKEREEKRREREESTDKGKLLSTIKKGEIKLKPVVKCDYGLVWDPRLKKCVPIQENITPKEATEAITQTLKEMPQESQSSTCNIV